jgi:hypothetical protein
MVDKELRGEHAESLLNDVLLNEVFETLDREYLAAWRNSKHIEQREDAHRYVQLIERLKGHLQSVATTGELSRRQQRDLEGKKGFF